MKRTVFYYNEKQKKTIEEDYGTISENGFVDEDIIAIFTKEMFFDPYISVEDKKFLTVEELSQEIMQHLYVKCMVCDNEECEKDCSPFYEDHLVH